MHQLTVNTENDAPFNQSLMMSLKWFIFCVFVTSTHSTDKDDLVDLTKRLALRLQYYFITEKFCEPQEFLPQLTEDYIKCYNESKDPCLRGYVNCGVKVVVNYQNVYEMKCNHKNDLTEFETEKIETCMADILDDDGDRCHTFGLTFLPYDKEILVSVIHFMNSIIDMTHFL